MTGSMLNQRTPTLLAGLALAALLALTGACQAEARCQGQGQGMCGAESDGATDFWSPGWMNRGMWRGGKKAGSDVHARMSRHRTFMHDGIPSEYREAKSPLKPIKSDIEAGATLYTANCASCHGAKGFGDGEAAKGLTPSPALLAYLIQRPRHSGDAYLLWTISEGGEQLQTDMPAFKKTLSRDEMWRIIAYMRAGFPEVAKVETE